jgi:hypothetical protein
LRSSGRSRPGGGPKTPYPRLPCPQAPLQSMTTAVSQPIPVSATPVDLPFRTGLSSVAHRCLYRTASITGAPPMAAPTTSGRASKQHPSGSAGGDLRRGCTGRGQKVGGHGVNPKVLTGPPRAEPPNRSRETSLPNPLGPGRQAIRDQMREPAAFELVADNTQVP